MWGTRAHHVRRPVQSSSQVSWPDVSRISSCCSLPSTLPLLASRSLSLSLPGPFPRTFCIMASEFIDPRMTSVKPRIRYNTIGGINGPLVVLDNVRLRARFLWILGPHEALAVWLCWLTAYL